MPVDIRVELEANLSQDLTPIFNATVIHAINTTLLLVRDKWQQEAQKKLNSTRTDYLLGLSFDAIQYPYNNNPFSGAVVLQGKFPNMLETGFSAFDMKTGFSKSPKRLSSSTGWYLTIPFRHSTPGSFMYGKPMPVDIYAEAKKLPNKGRLNNSKGEVLTSWTGYKHKSNIYDKMTRYKKGRGSTYVTFRRVSNNSDPLSWWHPGFTGVKIADSLEGYATRSFEACLKANLGQAL